MPTVERKQIGQSRPSSTTAASLYSPGAFEEVELLSLWIANTTSSTAKFRLFHDEDGSTYDETTSLAWDVSVSGNTAVQVVFEKAYMRDSDGNFGVRTDTASALTFTLYGVVTKVSDFERTRQSTVSKPSATAAARVVS